MSLAPIWQDLNVGGEEENVVDTTVDVISDVAVELMADTIDSLIEFSNSLVRLISEPEDEKPCICTKYVVREGEDG